MSKEYIEKEAFKTLLNEAIYDSCGNLLKVGGLKDARNLLETFTPADVKPVVRGEWIRKHNDVFGWLWKCSECHYGDSRKSNFCPNCGADMRKEDK